MSAPEEAPMAVRSAQSAARLAWVDGLRAICALYVVGHHCVFFAFASVPAFDPTVERWVTPLLFGKQAVAVFLVISGFCIGLPIVRGDYTCDFKHFIVRRCRRILPAYYGALAAAILLAFIGRTVDFGFRDVLAHAFLVHNFYNRLAINGPMWSIAIEWQVYFLVPLILLLWRKLGGAACLWVTSVVCTAAYLALEHSGWNSYTWIYPALFVAGMYAAHLTVHGISERYPTGPATLVSWIAVFGVCSWYGWIWMAGTVHAWTNVVGLGLLGFATVNLIIYLATGEHRARRVFSTPWLAKVGLFSYSLYLIHAPILGLIKAEAPISGWALFGLQIFLGLPLSVLVARYFAKAFEEPFMRTTRQADRTVPVLADGR